MIRHTVAFSLVHPAGSDAESEFLTSGPELLRSIAGVHEFTVSRQVSPKSEFRFQFSMSFIDAAAYSAYNDHPDHQRFVATRWANEVTVFEELDFTPYP
jgi:hypothetical protein